MDLMSLSLAGTVASVMAYLGAWSQRKRVLQKGPLELVLTISYRNQSVLGLLGRS